MNGCQASFKAFHEPTDVPVGVKQGMPSTNVHGRVCLQSCLICTVLDFEGAAAEHFDLATLTVHAVSLWKAALAHSCQVENLPG
jgi:hypothetical protein